MEQENTSVDTRRYMKLLLRRKWLWIIPTVVFTIGATINAINQPDIYKSRCVLAVEDSKLLHTVLSEPERGIIPDTEKILRNVSNIMLGWEPVVKVIKSLELDKDIPEDDTSALEKQYNKITRSVELRVGDEKSRNYITVYCQGTDPEWNVLVLNGLVSNFIEQSMYITQAEVEETIAFVDEEVDRLKSAFYETERKLRLYQEEHFGELPGDRENILSDLLSAERELASIDGEMITLREKLDFLQERTDEGVLLLTPIASNLNQQIIDLEIHIETLQARYSDEHPEIVMRKQELDHLKKALARESDKVVAELGSSHGLTEQEFDMQLKLKSLERRRVNVESVIVSFKESVEGESGLGQDYYALQKEYEINKGLYEQRLLQRSKADLMKEISLDEKTNPFTIIEPARVSYKPLKVDKIKTIITGFLVGAGLGIGLIFGLERIDQRFKTMEEAQEYLKIPALGMIPSIITTADVRRKVKKKIVMTSILVVFVIVVVTVSFVVQPVKDVVNINVTKAIKLVQ